MTKTFGEVRKKPESTNIKILGGPLHVMYCIVVVTMLASGHDRCCVNRSSPGTVRTMHVACLGRERSALVGLPLTPR